MRFKKILRFKVIASIGLIGIIAFGIWYYQLSNRHKAIVKTYALHTLRIIDHDWEVSEENKTLYLESPDLLVDNIYQSMDGPQAVIHLNMNPEGEKIKWITGFKAEVFQEGTTTHNNDLLCHTNIDYSDAIHHRNLNLLKRVNTVYPRLGTLSNGTNKLSFPEGYGFPVATDDAFIVASRTLNHNIEDAFFKVKHNIKIDVEEGTTVMKPLRSKGLVMMLPYDLEDPYKSNNTDPNLCSPLDLKNHSGPGPDGVSMSAHWVLPNGKTRYEFDISYQLNLQEDTSIHAMAAHLHPGAQTFILYDATMDEPLYTFHCENYENKVGLKYVPTYSNAEGLLLKKEHIYKLVLDTYNPSTEFRDMMAVLFIYTYDREMEEMLVQKKLIGA